MENKKILEAFIAKQNSTLLVEDKIKIIDDVKSITIDLGFYSIKQIVVNSDIDKSYDRLYQTYIDYLYFEFKKAKTNGK